MSDCVNAKPLDSSGRAKTKTLKRVLSPAGLLLSAAILSGCSSLGALSSASSSSSTSALGIDNSVATGSITSSSPGNLLQPLPGSLSSGSSSVSATSSNIGPYLPPNNVGTVVSATNLRTASIAPGANNSTTVIAQDLPALSQPTNVGSQQTMQAQSIATPLFPDNAVPQVTQPSAPKLSVVRNSGFEHTIEPGESLYTIARRYDVSTTDIVSANNLAAPDQIFVGQKLTIPGRSDLLAANASRISAPAIDPVTGVTNPVVVASVASPTQTGRPAPVRIVSVAPIAPVAQVASIAPIAPVTTAAPATPTAPVASIAPTAATVKDFRWPVRGRVIVDFESSRRTGINIEAPEGAAVRAAESGSVIYVGNGVEGFGNLILVRHDNGFVSAYAHLKDITTAKNDRVTRGDQIGSIGMTGSVTRPQLHFELRQGATPVDPMPLLAN